MVTLLEHPGDATVWEAAALVSTGEEADRWKQIFDLRWSVTGKGSLGPTARDTSRNTWATGADAVTKRDYIGIWSAPTTLSFTWSKSLTLRLTKGLLEEDADSLLAAVDRPDVIHKMVVDALQVLIPAVAHNQLGGTTCLICGGHLPDDEALCWPGCIHKHSFHKGCWNMERLKMATTRQGHVGEARHSW